MNLRTPSSSPIRNYTMLLQKYLEEENSLYDLNPDVYFRKLKKLTKTQFEELAKDVYDELDRRLYRKKELPFLPVNEELHPKRNQARQKLATLAKEKFNELVVDTYMEITIRYSKIIQDIINFDKEQKSASSTPSLQKYPPKNLEPNTVQNGQRYENFTESWDSGKLKNKAVLENPSHSVNNDNITKSQYSTASTLQHSKAISPEVDALKTEIGQLKQELKLQIEKNKALLENQEHFHIIEESNRAFAIEISSLKNKNSLLTEQVEQLEAENSSLNEKISTLNLQISNLKSEPSINRPKSTISERKPTSILATGSDNLDFEEELSFELPAVNQGLIQLYSTCIDEMTILVINIKINPKGVTKNVENQLLTCMNNVISSTEKIRKESLRHRKIHLRYVEALKNMKADEIENLRTGMFDSEISPSSLTTRNLEHSTRELLSRRNNFSTSDIELNINDLQWVISEIFKNMGATFLSSTKDPHKTETEKKGFAREIPESKRKVEEMQNKIMINSNCVVDEIQSVLQLLRLSPSEKGNDDSDSFVLDSAAKIKVDSRESGSISVILNDNIHSIIKYLERMINACQKEFENKIKEESLKADKRAVGNTEAKFGSIDYSLGLQAVNGLGSGMQQLKSYCQDIADVVEMVEEPDESLCDYVYGSFNGQLKNFDLSKEKDLIFCARMLDDFVTDLIQDHHFKQNVISIVFEIAKNTKTLVTLFN
ncbi:hypothetical protein BB560_005615 [Smittium megazygosporum]|uniref:GIT Spa2 homology (SHD) domain-containing protein n=1 Tax=Smittium megazygosporum TaxID=133381 RepID=A0A2T9Z2A9_9FUNG|nr:hypothetical protein BB560_005615 [Smittium megazygosporum]